MIDTALSLLQSELDTALRNRRGDNPDAANWATLANVASLESDNSAATDALNNQVLVSLVNIEEESAFKNLPNFTKTATGVRYANPPAFLNLYLLFTANFPPDRYPRALGLLGDVIRFFQGNNVFMLKNAVGPTNNLPGATDPDAQQMQLILDLYTMTFEQINHLWGSLGGKQRPFAMYKARLVKLDDRRASGIGPFVEEVEIGSKAP